MQTGDLQAWRLRCDSCLQAARVKAIALRKLREAEAEDAERKRKEAAAAKLKELEDRIARKKAEQCVPFPCSQPARAGSGSTADLVQQGAPKHPDGKRGVGTRWVHTRGSQCAALRE